MPQPQPLVSIIVPVYNAEDYLHYCVDSILGQSYTNLEVILVDDGAKDSSPAICDAYAKQDPRVKVIHQTNGGISKAQNAGLDAAHGEYIAFSDNDDILDRRNIEYLLHALVNTGADMSKARWRQFGVSQLDAVAAEAAAGAEAPGKITVFEHPLAAYQTVFCKSLRLIGDKLGRNTEARYFNEANWCRLYKRELWDGIRFPEGMYAQDVMVAGELYTRMGKVADLDVNLYNWLQSAGSVTHKERSFSFYHDNFVAGATNFRLCLEQGVRPGRSYYTLVGSFQEETTAPDFNNATSQQQRKQDTAEFHELFRKLPLPQRLHCAATRQIRLLEKHIYDAKIKNMK
ncbi:glycosyltransferase involved in cell wall biogenesis [Bifidobacterium saguini DSM 23967]|uniref:Glycosyltransferase involved in cell wall biogenesis n=2 Tax=Bifidobacterium saguini TaxID=762210 RepID=A0A087DED7_9BIFI|nr:glycosyltransferase [Bifidobacterium saguini]KFI93887.1 glycosyltransferase involved in cell wall biogenesis [Bifidobacterium saguini DSM 23967]QTB90076.1 glycosyltransferase [Bifidobacterium saguini]